MPDQNKVALAPIQEDEEEKRKLSCNLTETKTF